MAEDLVVIRTFARQADAQLAQAVLTANGIESVLLRDDAGGMIPALDFSSEVRLAVRPDDAGAAEDLLGP